MQKSGCPCVYLAENVGPVMPVLLQKLAPLQKHALVRVLSGVDEAPIPDATLQDYLDESAGDTDTSNLPTPRDLVAPDVSLTAFTPCVSSPPFHPPARSP